MTNFWIKLIVGSVILTGSGAVCLAQGTALPPLAPDPSVQISITPTQPATAVSQSAPAGQTIYDGEAASDAGLILSPWGGGTISEDGSQSVDAGKHSLLIESPGFYQGGTVSFSQPLALGDLTDKTKYLQIMVKVASDPKYAPPTPPVDQSSPGSGGYQPGSSGTIYGETPHNGRDEDFEGSSKALFRLAQSTGTPWGETGSRGPGGYYGTPSGPGGQNNPYIQNTVPAAPTLPADALHILFTFADGTQTDISRALVAPETVNDWIKVSLPLSKLGVNSTTEKLKSLTLATDSPTLLSLGQVTLVTDNSPIVADAGGSKDVSANSPTPFTADITAGASTVLCQWDFDTQSSFVDEAEGETAQHTYTTTGTYTVTLVVSDVDGIKAPVTSTTTVHVEQ